MRNGLLAAVLLLACAGCAAPALVTRPIHSEQDLLVRLDSYADPGKAGDLRYDHPAAWTEADVRAILERLLLQERGGLFDSSRPTRAVLSSGTVARLAPHLVTAFRSAYATEWVAFHLGAPVGAGREVTSGAFFLSGGRLHVVIANYREPVADGAEAVEVRANPFRSLRGTRGTLTFDPPRFVLGSQAHWAGGSAPAGSELILDQRGFLESHQPAAAEAKVPRQAAQPTGEAMALQDEVILLKRKVQEQSDEIARLKQRLSELESRKP